MVDFLGVCAYNVRICDHIPDFCPNNMLVQHVAIDGSGNRKEECLCKRDYNGLQDIFAEFALENIIVEKIDIVGLPKIAICKRADKSTSRMLNLSLMAMKLLATFERGVEGAIRPDEDIVNLVIERLERLLQSNTISTKVLKRFLDENDTSEDLNIDPKTTNNKCMFLYYLLYKIGKGDVDSLFFDDLKEIVKKLNGKENEIVINHDNIQIIIDEMLTDTEYSLKISKGARIVFGWKE